MLRKFKVSNFKSFEKDFVLDLTKTNGYEFNKSAIKNGTVNNAIIYGQNGSGKSNLAFALFDIVESLKDDSKNIGNYKNFLNAFSNQKEASFSFEFLINSQIVQYEYRKSEHSIFTFEQLIIDNNLVIFYDRTNGEPASITLKGAETLHRIIDNNSLSILKYVKNNAVLKDTDTNKTFLQLYDFITKMLFFRSLMKQTRIGLDIEPILILQTIIENGNLKNFEEFLNHSGIECTLEEFQDFDRKTIVFRMNDKLYPFSQVASTGTMALTIFYFWYQNITDKNAVSFLFIDEFDAFYHHSLSELVVEKLKKSGVQFMITTHNTSIMSNDILRPDCYFEMTKNEIQSFSKITNKELREAHNLEKMYKSQMFNV